MNQCIDLKICTWKSEYWVKTINKNRIKKDTKGVVCYLRIGNYK